MSGCASAEDNGDVADGAANQALESGDIGAPIERAYFVRLDGPSAVGALRPGQTVRGAKGKAVITRRLAELKASHATLRPALEARGATIIGDFRKVANAFQVVTTAAGARRLAELAGVALVERSPVYYPSLSTGLAAVQAPMAWDNGGGTPFTGQGVRMGIIDTGVDYLHADFGGSGDPDDYTNNDPDILEPGTFPNARVIGGFDLAGDGYNGENIPSPDPDPLDCLNADASQHGTHVAGIAAGSGVLTDGTTFLGPYNASFDPSTFSVAPGVAPEADLYALKVFGCTGGTTLLLQAFEWAIDPNGDNDLGDRLDVVNLSLGSTFALSTGTSDIAARNLHQAGTLLVAAAGNDGDTTFAHGSPASLPEVLSVGASLAVASAELQVTAPVSVAGDYAGAEGAFTAPLSPTGISGEIVAVEPSVGCDPLTNAAAVAGKIAFVQRGSCTFLQKFSGAEAAGAIAVVMVNNEPGVFQMGGDGNSPLPGFMISQADGATLLAALNQGTVTGTLLLPAFTPGDESFAASLSSRGPSVIDGALKPDISAPGVNVVSASGGTGIDGVANTGTSMACPFVAGAAAVVRQAFPTLEPRDVKALMMSANEPLRSFDGQAMPIAYQGSGRLALADILDQTAFLRSQDVPDAVSLSFGHIESLETVATTRTANLVNLGGVAVTYDLTVERVHPLPGVTITVDPPSITVPPQSTSETITVEIVVDPTLLGDPDPDPVTGATTAVFGAEGGQVPVPRVHLNEADGWLVATSQAGEEARVPFHGSVRAGASRHAEPGPYCDADGESATGSVVATVSIVGASSHPTPVTTAFELGALDDVDPALPSRSDLRAVGAATNRGVFVGAFEDAEVYFGVAVEGTWRTAAIPEVPLVSIEIDLDGDQSLDYLLVPEPNSRTAFAFADYLVARSYIIGGVIGCNVLNLDSCERAPYEDRLQLNLVPADELDTAPFFNGVIVLAALTRSMGLSEAEPSFRYRARTLTPDGDSDFTEWASFDVTAPAVDPAGLAPTAGIPLYTGDLEVRARIAPGASDPRLLLLHHHNPERTTSADGEELRRFEVVALSAASSAPLTLNAPSSAATGDTITLVASWTNTSEATLTDVALELSTTAGVIADAVSTTATCDGAVCTVAALGPGETIDATADVLAQSPGDNLVTAEVTSTGGCPIAESATLTVTDGDPPPVAGPSLVVSGGCACRLENDSPESSPRAAWLLGLAGLGLLRRRRR